MTSFRNVHLACLLFSIICIVNSITEDDIPVLIYESFPPKSQETRIPALAKMSHAEFSRFIDKKLLSYQQPLVMFVFAEDTLSVEDLSLKDASGMSSFPHLQELVKRSHKNVTFLPSVSEPNLCLEEAGIRHTFQIQSLDINTATDKTSNPLLNASASAGNSPRGKINLVHLDVARRNESRHALLRRHDLEIARVLSSRPEMNLIVVYTGLTAAPLRRVRRQEPGPSPTAWYDKSGILVFFNAGFPKLVIDNDNVSGEVIKVAISAVSEESHQILVLAGTVAGADVTLRLHFKSSSAYWEMAGVEFQVTNGPVVKLPPPIESVVVATNFSYVCRGEIVFANGDVRLTFTNVQIQAFMTTPGFSASQDCAAYLSIGILTGIISMFFMAVVLSGAVVMIMNIKINDKLDDPRGKTIHVGVGQA